MAHGKSCYVAPFAGAWIEISVCPSLFVKYLVAPFAGAWIEILERRLKWEKFI